MLSWVEHEKSIITFGPGLGLNFLQRLSAVELSLAGKEFTIAYYSNLL